MAHPGVILIREVVDAPVIMGISKLAGLKPNTGEVKIVNPLFVGIDVGSQNNTVYLMKPDGEKHSSFRMQNNCGGANCWWSGSCRPRFGGLGNRHGGYVHLR